ncbi:plastocyanin/azurin family copper-binding protein [Sulfitobacter sp. F26169L]|uniref:cupredoxin domain-containing protein n=1 Tax=Sulfitobacter sp. F26169L TaxID=2996015 RepID=UPI002260A458|nr:plastocyanin/azurin family copper-binding protein [Sulfitobacter sp. F26169L]MCX7568252.1 plastocyanin/azurin family copper-binding protein [Sulfitobacter sp. F26169L]
MKSFFMTLLTLSSLNMATVSAQASTRVGDEPHARAYDHLGHVPIGKPASGKETTRTIEINIEETKSGYMLFDPDAIHIKEGAVVRFVINNFGDLDHEFFLGSFDEIKKHQQWMREHPEMKHEDPNAVSIPSGSSKTLDWNFSSKTNLEFVCLVPGHREAGMFGVIMVHDHLAPKQ